MQEKILTQHPQGKKGVNISTVKYHQVKDFIQQCLRDKGEMSFEELAGEALRALQPVFDGKVLWYLVKVKLDLEARQLITRIPKSSPQKLRLVQK